MDGVQLRESALKIVTEFRHASSGPHKKQLVEQLAGLDIERVPLCVEDILHEVVALDYTDETSEVQAELVKFVRKISSINLGWEVLCSVVDWLSGMLSQENSAVVLAIVQSCPSLTRNIFIQALDKGMSMPSSHGWRDAWAKSMSLLRSVIDTVLKVPMGPIVLYAAKLVEQCVLMFTNPSGGTSASVEQHLSIPPSHPVFNVGHLHSMSQVLVQKLVSMISSKIPLNGLAQIAVLKALGSIAHRRANFSGRIVPALLDLASSGKYKVASMCRTNPDVDGVEVSISTALKEALLGALMNHDPTACVWRKRLLESLQRIGAANVAERVVRRIEKQAERDKRCLSPEEQDGTHHSKRLRTTTDHGQTPLQMTEETYRHDLGGTISNKLKEEQTNGLKPQKRGSLALFAPLAQHAQDGSLQSGVGLNAETGDNSHQEAMVQSTPALDGDHDVAQVRAMLGLLTSIGQRKLLHGFVKNLDIRILADVVIANLKDLPLRTEILGLSRAQSNQQDRQESLPLFVAENEEGSPEAYGRIWTAKDDQSDLLDNLVHDGSISDTSSDGVRAPSVDSDEDSRTRGPLPDVENGGDVFTLLPTPIGTTQSGQIEHGLDIKLEIPDDGDKIGGEVARSESEDCLETQEEADNMDVDKSHAHPVVDLNTEKSLQEIHSGSLESLQPKQETTVTLPMGCHDANNVRVNDSENWASEMPAEEGEETCSMDDMDQTDRLEILPRPLTMEQSIYLMEQGVSPLIKANVVSNKYASFSQGILAKLASVARVAQSPAHDVLEHIVENFPEKTAQDLAVKWLFSVFLCHGGPAWNKVSGHGWDDVEEGTESPPVTSMDCYEEALSVLLERLTTRIGDPKDKSCISLLLAIPLLPIRPVTRFLQVMSSKGSLYSTMALTSANTLMEERPPMRHAMLQLILGLATGSDRDTREKAVRLVKNRLYNESEFTASIDAFATRMLQRLRVRHEEYMDANAEKEQLEDSEELEKFCSLYMALCTAKKSFLRGLMEVYGEAGDSGKDAISANAPKLADAIGYNSPELLELIRDTPPGGDQLLLMMLNVMPGRIPSPMIVHACKNRFDLKDDVRFIVPALPGLPKREALAMVPRLTRLSTPEFSAAILALIARARIDEAIEPSEVLVALNRANLSEQGVKLADVRVALDHCVRGLVDIFDREALAGALNKMVQLPSLPLLFMRMVLVSIVREKTLCAFVLGTLFTSTVVIEKILKERNQWKGYLVLMCKTVPLSYKHLLELPTTVLKAVLRDSSREFVKKFQDYVAGSECDIRIPVEAMMALMDSTDKSEPEPSLLGESGTGGSLT